GLMCEKGRRHLRRRYAGARPSGSVPGRAFHTIVRQSTPVRLSTFHMLVSHTKPCDPLTGAAGSGLTPEKSPHRQGGLERHEPSTSGPDECLIGTNVDCGGLPTLDPIWTAASVAWDEVLNPSTMDRTTMRTPGG